MILCKIDIEEQGEECIRCCQYCKKTCERKCIFAKRHVKCDNEVIKED